MYIIIYKDDHNLKVIQTSWWKYAEKIVKYFQDCMILHRVIDVGHGIRSGERDYRGKEWVKEFIP